MGTGSLPRVKRPGRGADHPPPPKRRGHERVGLYLYSPSGPSWPVIERTFTFLTVPFTQIPNLMEIPVVGADLCHADGQT